MGRARSRANSLARLLDTVPRPVYVVDRHRTLVYGNAACGDLLKTEVEPLLGQTCVYSAQGEDPEPRLVNSLCPPPESFAGTRVEQPISILDATGTAVDQYGVFLPLGNDRQHCPAVLTVLLPPAPRATTPPIEWNAPQLHQQLMQFRHDFQIGVSGVDALVGRSRAMHRIRNQIRLAASGNTHVVVVGPRGSGREHIARALHYQTTHAATGPLAPVVCPAMNAESLQNAIRIFARQVADLATPVPPALLLLEVDQLPTDAQGELMGFLDLPGFHLFTIATASQSLIALAQADAFREDLANTLGTLVIEVPPLHERAEDIPLLAQHFLERFNDAGGAQRSGFTPEALDEMVGYAWPGNIDEFAEVVEAACQRASGPWVEPSALAEQLRLAAGADAHPPRSPDPVQLDQLLLEIEQEMIRRALRLSKGNKAQAARLLGISRARLHRRIDHFGIA